MHIPVLLQEVVELLNPRPGQFFIDGTLGAGGHAREIISRISPDGIFLGIDRDQGAVKQFQSCQNTTLKKCLVVNANYAELPTIVQNQYLGRADGLLLDLGFSSEQLSDGVLAGRGFSFLSNEPLLMTYDNQSTPVKDLLMQMSEQELEEVIRKFSQERYARRISKAIKENLPINTADKLTEVIKRAVPGLYDRGRINPATRTFMALRIHANQEFVHLENTLKNLDQILKIGGKVGIISFHSEEDRVVKHTLKDEAKKGKVKILTKKPVPASEEEIKENPRSRSAKLRVAELI